MILKLVECSDHEYIYGILDVKNPEVSGKDIQEKIGEYKNSYKAYGYKTEEEVLEEYDTIEKMMENEYPCWNIEDMVAEAFPPSWEVGCYIIDGVVEC